MTLSTGTQNFWSQQKNYLLSSGITIVVIFWYFGAKIGISITFFLFLCYLWLLSDIKSKLLMGLPDQFQYESAILTDYPLLNFTWLQQQTNELESLGFVQLIDYKIGDNPCFGRCFAHPQYYCYAEVGELFKATGESFSRQASIASHLDENWELATINREVDNVKDSVSYGLWRKPKAVRLYSPNLSWEELLQKHLEFRQRMVADLGITVLTDVSWENYVNIQQEATIYRKRSLQKKILLLAMIEVTQFELNPKSEWLGDYAKFVA
ncbi:MAG TPA: hypothetical protein VK211_04060 [Kamptonema sp.]|nr:hypothetical protein [Kamptonema sp.]